MKLFCRRENAEAIANNTPKKKKNILYEKYMYLVEWKYLYTSWSLGEKSE